MPAMKLWRANDFDLECVEPVLDALLVFRINILIGHNLLKEPLAIVRDALSCLLGSDLIEKGVAQVLLKIPCELRFLLFGERVTHHDGIFWAMIKAHRRCGCQCSSGPVGNYGFLADSN